MRRQRARTRSATVRSMAKDDEEQEERPICDACMGAGGEHEPAERGERPPPEGPPPAWEHRVWSDPWISHVLGCRFCLGAKKVSHIEAGTLVTVPCRCADD